MCNARRQGPLLAQSTVPSSGGPNIEQHPFMSQQDDLPCTQVLGNTCHICTLSKVIFTVWGCRSEEVLCKNGNTGVLLSNWLSERNRGSGDSVRILSGKNETGRGLVA